MAAEPIQSPPIKDTPGAFPETPADSLRQQSSYVGSNGAQPTSTARDHPLHNSATDAPATTGNTTANVQDPQNQPWGETTAVPSPADSTHQKATPAATSDSSPDEEKDDALGGYAPLKTHTSRPDDLHRTASGRQLTENELFTVLSRRRTGASGFSKDSDDGDEQQEIRRLMSRMFGQGRQANSEEEKTRHVGVIFKNLTVKGVGLGAALQPTTGDVFLGFPRFLAKFFSKGKKASGKAPVRTILNDFTGCVKPGEMLLVLGRPGAGCSTFLKVIGNQRAGFEDVSGDVTYGGADSKTMAKDFRGEVLYNPEDDLHYATLTVKETLEFALKTRTPGKNSRNEGETRKQYVAEFLRVVAKLFWIEHTMMTKVGDSLTRGVSGGEKKRYVT